MMRKIAGFILIVFIASCVNSSGSPTQDQKNEIIVDVRTADEWAKDGHAVCSVNVPLEQLPNRLDELRNYSKVILVCSNGDRAAMAEKSLKRQGFTNTENQGSWKNIICP